jgi:hypothetical protein
MKTGLRKLVNWEHEKPGRNEASKMDFGKGLTIRLGNFEAKYPFCHFGKNFLSPGVHAGVCRCERRITPLGFGL